MLSVRLNVVCSNIMTKLCSVTLLHAFQKGRCFLVTLKKVDFMCLTTKVIDDMNYINFDCLIDIIVGGNFVVLHQSQGCTLPSNQVAIVYCIASNHSSSCKYQWRNSDGDVGVNSPVLYVNKPGVYRCTVHCGGQQCFSRSINVLEGKEQ